jgi:hypothetical protein
MTMSTYRDGPRMNGIRDFNVGRVGLRRTSMEVFDGAGIIGGTSTGNKLPGGFSVFLFPISASRVADACRPRPKTGRDSGEFAYLSGVVIYAV